MATVKGYGRSAVTTNTMSRTLTLTNNPTDLTPIALEVGDRVIAILGVATRGINATATVAGQPIPQLLPQVSGTSADSYKFSGHASHVFELMIEEDVAAGASLVVDYSTTLVGASTSPGLRTSIAYVVLSGVGADHYLSNVAADSFALAASVNTVTTPGVVAPADSVEVSLVADSENDTTGPDYGTTAWTAPSPITKVVEDVNATSGNPQSSVAIGVDLTPTAISGTRGEREWDATNDTGTARSAWTLVYAPDNARPVANPGPTLVVEPFAPFDLNGSASTDDVSVASYTWTQLSGTPVTLTGTGAVRTVAEAPASADGETLTFQLVVTDDEGAVSNPATVTVTVLPANLFAATGSGWVPMRKTWL